MPGLVLDQEVQGGVVPEPDGRLDDAAHERLGQIAGCPEAYAERGEQPGHLGVDHRAEDLVPATGEGTVDGGPGDPGLTGDVVDGRLDGPVAGEAGQGAVDDAHPVR